MAHTLVTALRSKSLWPLAVVVVLLLAACAPSSDPAITTSPSDATTTSVPDAQDTNTTSTSATSESADGDILDTSLPLRILAPLPPAPPGETGNPLVVDGSADYWLLFDADALWEQGRSTIDAFKIHGWQIRSKLSDAELMVLLDYLDTHSIPLMLEMEPLDPPTTCRHNESFEGPYELQTARRIERLGGVIAAVAIEQPYTYGHKNDGEGECQYTVDRVVDEVVEWISDMREIYPGVPVGSIEGIWQSPATTPRDMEIWLDAYEAAAGEPFAFLHMDVDWLRSDWPEVLLGIEEVADEREVPFGVLYTGGHGDDSDAWLQATIDHVATYEQLTGGSPDHVVFQSWTDKPDTLLPETSLSGFTHLLTRYDGARLTMSNAVVSEVDGQIFIEGTVVDETTGNGVSGLEVTALATPVTGAVQTVTTIGVVPEGATEALILVRSNAEDAGSGALDVEVYEVAYREDNDAQNRVPNGDMSRGNRDWEVYNTTGDVRFASDGSISEAAMTLMADPGDSIQIDGSRFPTTPGAAFEMTVRMLARPSPGVPHSGYVSVAFFADGAEIERRVIQFEPVPFAAGSGSTDEAGSYSIGVEAASSGIYDLTLRTPGGLDAWPAFVTTSIEIPDSQS
ncbi:MAG: hypothetical protein M3132_03530 [Actinomycetia bacterium]|nr:hypothetical protein [Actinomycetes bacterium]